MSANRIALLGLLLAGACSQESLAPSADVFGPNLKKVPDQAAYDCRPYNTGNSVVAFGLTHWPIGGASLNLTSAGKLRIQDNQVPGFGVCTQLPSVASVAIQFGGHVDVGADGNGFKVDLAGSTGPAAKLRVRRRPNGNLEGLFDIAAKGCTLTVETRRNGQLTRSASGNRVTFPLPANFGILGYSWGAIRGGGWRLAGNDAAGNSYAITGTPKNVAKCSPKLTEAITRFGGTIEAVTFMNITFEY